MAGYNKENEKDALELNDHWQVARTLGFCEEQIYIEGVETVSSENTDPWSELLQTPDVELVNLQDGQWRTLHVSLSENDIEQVLQFMQEQ